MPGLEHLIGKLTRLFSDCSPQRRVDLGPGIEESRIDLDQYEYKCVIPIGVGL